MKILFFIESLHSGGKERRLVELIKGLSRDPNFEMELVLTKENIHYTEIERTGIKIHFFVRKIKKDPRIFIKFYSLAKKYKPDIIHVWGNMVAIYAIPTKIILGIPMINNEITDARINVSKSILSHKLTFPFSDKIISNSYAGLEAYNAPANKSSVIYNGFEFDRINNLESKDLIRDKFNIKTKFIVAMVASFTVYKDYTTFIKAALELLITNNDVTFLCIGGGDFEKYKQIIGHENEINILFLGKQENIESIMNVCDIGVLISNSKLHGEGISNSLLEFMALSKPVIANDCGGTIEIVENNKNGFIIEDQNYLDLKDKILTLLEDENLRIMFGQESIKIVTKFFSIEKMINSFKLAYNDFFFKNN